MEDRKQSAEAVAKREQSRMQGGAKLLPGSAGGFTPAKEHADRVQAEKEAGLRDPDPIQIVEPENKQLAVYREAMNGMRAIPNHVSTDPDSPFFMDGLGKMGVKFNGVPRKKDVQEFNVSEGWIRVHIRDNKGNWKKSRGRYITVKLNGVVEPYWES